MVSLFGYEFLQKKEPLQKKQLVFLNEKGE